MRVLIINPNTSAPVTRLLHDHLQARLPADWQLEAVTAAFGASYIASEAAYAIAAHAVLAAWAGAPVCERVLIGCFGDPGLEALREVSGLPVIGLAESAMQAAAVHGRFGIVTGGERWRPILQRRAQAAGLAAQLCDIRIVPQTGAELLADRARAVERLAAAARDSVRERGADAVLIGGAALAGMGDELASMLPFPVIDNVTAAAGALRAPQGAMSAHIERGIYSGLAPGLTERLA